MLWRPPVRGIYDLSPISGHCCQTRLMAQILCPVVIGRDAELEAIDAALAAAVAGHGGCVVITGEPGIGKSRLALETASRAASRGIRVVTSRAVPQSATAAYRPLTDALVQLLRDRAVPDDASDARSRRGHDSPPRIQ